MTMYSYPKRRLQFFTTSLVGNVLDHYDTALYGFLAPFIAPHIFQDQDPLIRLILTYGLLSISFITRPLGSWFFGKLAFHRSAKEIFASTLLGMAFTTLGMALLPSYHTLGAFAAVVLTLLRALQGFFAAGENTLAPLLMLQYTEEKRLSFTGSIYQSSVVLGILIASCLATLVSYFPQYPDLWRLPFLLGSSIAVVGWYIRYNFSAFTGPIFSAVTQDRAREDGRQGSTPQTQLWRWISQDKRKFLGVVMASSFTYLTYSVPFVLFNSFVPLVSNITLSDMLTLNTALLAFDMLLLPVLGALADLYDAKKLMCATAFLLACVLVPFFMYLPSASLLGVTLIRIAIVIPGLLFLAPLQGWFYKQYTGKEKYMLVGVGYALGSEVFGRSIPAICLWLWHQTTWVAAPAIYLALLCLATALLLTFS